MVGNWSACSARDQYNNGPDYWYTYGSFHREHCGDSHRFGFFANNGYEDFVFDYRPAAIDDYNHFAG